MGGFFGVVSKEKCITDLFFGVDYHSHLGPRRGGLAVYGPEGFERSIHNIENSPFRSKFEKDLVRFTGNIGLGCISDYEPQPLLISSHLGSFAIATVGRCNNIQELKNECLQDGAGHFSEMSKGHINVTELMASLIVKKDSIVEGLKYIHEVVKGTMSVLVMTTEGIYCSRDKFGRLPVIIAKKEGAYCVTFESSAYLNLGYTHVKDLGPGEIVYIDADHYEVLSEPYSQMKMCSFLWVYYGYPTSTYEGKNIEHMRVDLGRRMALRDNADADLIAGVPDSGIAHAIGYSNETKITYGRPFIKYTPTWARSFMPSTQIERNLVAGKKLIPVQDFIKDKKMLLIDDSIVRGTQLGETTQFLYDSGAKEVHVRPACPPIMFGCKFLNFSRSSSEMALISRRVICDLENKEEVDLETIKEYVNPDGEKYKAMVDEICKRLNFTSLDYARLDEMIESIGLDQCQLCTYCWTGEE